MVKVLLSVILVLSFFRSGSQIVNHPPVVKIIHPANNVPYIWNSLQPYAIEISDAEDGESKFQEIPSSEVLVKLKYTINATAAKNYAKQKRPGDAEGVYSMVVSNCFSCHAVRSKMSGPSFQDISNRYPNTIVNRDKLVKHIQNGSTGIWGKEVMPTHPELKDSVIRKMVLWILHYANDQELNYFAGIEGVLPLNKPGLHVKKGIYIVSAMYMDHGTPDEPGKRMMGTGSIWLRMK